VKFLDNIGNHLYFATPLSDCHVTFRSDGIRH